MIHINLLPAELRHGRRVSPKLLAVGIGGAIAVSSAMGWFGMVYFGQLAEVERLHAEATAQLVEKEKKVTYFEQLESNRQDYGSRVQTIQEIGKSRRLWSKFCDELIDIVNNNGETERHLAWFESMSVKVDPKKGTTVTLPGLVQGTEMERVANFHEDLEKSAPFAKDLASKSNPDATRDVDKSRIPPEAFRFPLVLTFKPTTPEQAPVRAKGK